MTRGAARRSIVAGCAAALTLGALAGIAPSAAGAPEASGTAVQVGTYDALVSPNYRGLMPVRQAARGTTLGLGTFDDLDGELVLVGGTAYRVSTDGRPTPIMDDRTTPFFEGVRFAPTASGPVAPGTTCANLAAAVTELAGGTAAAAGMVAVRVRGTFTDLVTRSVPKQAQPYPPLSDVVAKETEFPLGQRRAVLVGFFTGPAMKGVGAPGLHLHGVTADRTAGGHVLSCITGSDVQLSVQPLDRVTVVAPR